MLIQIPEMLGQIRKRLGYKSGFSTPVIVVPLLLGLSSGMFQFLVHGFVIEVKIYPALERFVSGVKAYRQGDYAIAFSEWLPLAEEGYDDAQYLLGLMYFKGEGVKQNSQLAYAWSNINNNRSEEETREGGGFIRQSAQIEFHSAEEVVDVENYQYLFLTNESFSIDDFIGDNPNQPETLRRFRDHLENHLSPSEINEAWQCAESNFEDCPLL